MEQGNSLTGRRFLVAGVKMALELQLDVDPDDSPWLQHLTSRQKELRRRVFWGLFKAAIAEQAISTDPTLFDSEFVVNPMGVKKSSQILDPHPIFALDRTNIYCELFALLLTVKRHYVTPPASINDLIASNATSFIASQLLASIPQDHMVDSTSLHFMSIIMPKNSIYSANTIVSFNLCLAATISVLHRPIMFASSLTCMHPMLLGLEQQSTIILAIQECLTAAFRIINIFSFIMEHEEAFEKLPDTSQERDRDPLDHAKIGGMMCIVEALIVVWFVSCRMNPAWWNFIKTELKMEYSVLRSWFVTLMECIQARDGQVKDPLVMCAEFMLKEMDKANSWCVDTSLIDDLEVIELGVKAIALGEDSKEIDGAISDPFGFLGLLGMEVDGRVRWRGRSEESWRLFWKLNA
ncbi:hypothetical protein HDU79_011708 [Rhizoclosmatium sp. JEL0117]|nr:hypothetical protein HDU79_011708 [Rhizoclosmatium sp. JEL0117]